MALVSRLSPQRIEIPHEPGEWLDVLPITARAISEIQKGVEVKTPMGVQIELLAQCVKAWSYPVPVSLENINDLDGATLTWLQTQVNVTSGVRTDQKKEISNGNSSPDTSLPQPESNESPPSSDI